VDGIKWVKNRKTGVQKCIYPSNSAGNSVSERYDQRGHAVRHFCMLQVKNVVIPSTRHEGIKGLKRYSSIHSQPRHQMEVSDQPHAPAALPPGKKALGAH